MTTSFSKLTKYTIFIKLICFFLLISNTLQTAETPKEKKQKVIGCVRLTKARIFLDSHFFEEIEKNHDPNGKLDYKNKFMISLQN